MVVLEHPRGRPLSASSATCGTVRSGPGSDPALREPLNQAEPARGVRQGMHAHQPSQHPVELQALASAGATETRSRQRLAGSQPSAVAQGVVILRKTSSTAGHLAAAADLPICPPTGAPVEDGQQAAICRSVC